MTITQRQRYDAELLLGLELLVMSRMDVEVEKIKRLTEEAVMATVGGRDLFNEHYDALKAVVTSKRFMRTIFADLAKIIKQTKGDN